MVKIDSLMQGGSIRGVVDLGGRQVEYEYVLLNVDSLILVKITRNTTLSLEKKLPSTTTVLKLNSGRNNSSGSSISKTNKWKKMSPRQKIWTPTMKTTPIMTTLRKIIQIEAQKGLSEART